MDNNADPKLNAPPKLVEALRRVAHQEIFVPPGVDDAILNAAHRHLQPKKQVRLGWPRFLLATAVTLLFLGLMFRIIQPSKVGPAKIVEDVNGDGRIDILDAFALARCMKISPATCAQFDMNRDGIIDGRDIEVLAARAVRLERRGGS